MDTESPAFKMQSAVANEIAYSFGAQFPSTETAVSS
jgi:hypothetical protein